ncbi:unnamed protein product [Adineta ricciae]|uniref:Uncharacterized protein n=1 Tax=Adineta ricciae TaxID=249248 RepID=A0A816AV15_ADIRI|nr:unnamed protein product [Adineta ricciae]CAF1601198.1 unnamed protein product [Adineta ricciae]
MSKVIRKLFRDNFLRRIFAPICITIILTIILKNATLKTTTTKPIVLDALLKQNSPLENELSDESIKYTTKSARIDLNATLETTVRCVGSVYNQSCLFENLYYVDSTFTMLIVKGKPLPEHSVRTDAFIFSNLTPNKREFDTYVDLQQFVRCVIQPKRFPYVTLHFGQPWHHNIGHALFDGLYPAYVAMIRFTPRHLYPFRILAGIDTCNDCWSEDVYSRFGGLGIIKHSVLNKLSSGRWYVFDEIVMGSGTMCQRCTRPDLQLAGGVELDASRLFRDRMYQQHGFLPLTCRYKSSLEHRKSNDILRAYVVDNKRFTLDDRKEINDAIEEINSYTYSYIHKMINNSNKLQWPLINVTYIHYQWIKANNDSSISTDTTAMDSRSPTYEINDNNFIAQLKLLRQMDIHITGPGTGQMYQTFLSDGSVSINIGGIRPWAAEGTPKAYTSFLEQHMTSGTPYIKGLYYPINERQKGIRKDEVVKLIRQAGKIILQGFSLPVNPRENLAPDGQLFVEMCGKDTKFCDSVTIRTANQLYVCIDLWIEDLVHEERQWKEGGYLDNGRNLSCPFNRTLLRGLRKKYGIKYRGGNSSKSI